MDINKKPAKPLPDGFMPLIEGHRVNYVLASAWYDYRDGSPIEFPKEWAHCLVYFGIAEFDPVPVRGLYRAATYDHGKCTAILKQRGARCVEGC